MKMRLRIGAYREEPYAFGCFLDLPKKSCARPGYEIEFLDTVMRLAQMDYELILHDELGELDPNMNKSSGLFGAVETGHVDLMSYFLRITAARKEQLAFSFALTSYKQFYMLQSPSIKLDYNNNAFQPFQRDVWFTLLVALLAVICSQWFIHCRLNALLLSLSNFKTVAWNTGSGILRFKAPGPKRPSSLAAAIIGGTWLLMWAVVLTRTYRTTLIGTLVVNLEVTPLPFRSLDELIYKLADKTLVLTDTPSNDYEPSCLDDLCERLNETLRANPVHIIPEGDKTNMIDQPNYVTSMMLENTVRDYDSFLYTDYPTSPSPLGIVDDDYPSEPGGMALRRDFPRPTLDIINQAIATVMPGYANMINRYRHHYPAVDMKVSLKNTQNGIKMEQFYQALYLWGAAMSAAITIFLIELLFPCEDGVVKRRRTKCNGKKLTKILRAFRNCLSCSDRVQFMRIGSIAQRLNFLTRLLSGKKKPPY